jgi:crossover junction endodeoxyribonuclease RusA
VTARTLRFWVTGTPATQGSKRAFVTRQRDGARRTVVVDANPAALRPWREAVRSTAVEFLAREATGPLSGPVRITLRFVLRRPSSAPRRRRAWPVGQRSGDVDKLARGVLDALTDAGAWTDDAQVVDLHVTKDYPTPAGAPCPGVLIRIEPVRDSGGGP